MDKTMDFFALCWLNRFFDVCEQTTIIQYLSASLLVIYCTITHDKSFIYYVLTAANRK